jgi:hypothetical protein
MPKKKGAAKRALNETAEEKAMRLEMERLKAIEDELHRAGQPSLCTSPCSPHIGISVVRLPVFLQGH